MKKAGSIKASTMKKGKSEPSVMEMEDRLETLKVQMAAERAKREQLLQRNGNGSVWLNGREGALRGQQQVKEFVRKGVKESKVRKAVQQNDADNEEQERASTASGASTERSTKSSSGSSSPHNMEAPSKPSKAALPHSIQDLSNGSRPATPPSRPGTNTERVVGDAATQPPRPSTAASMDDGGCQTERPARKEWVVQPMPRPKSARPMTYFDKIMAARRQQQQQQQQQQQPSVAQPVG